MKLILISLCIILFQNSLGFLDNTEYSVIESNGKYSIVPGSIGLCTGSHNFNQNETGWNFFTVQASLKATDEEKAYSAGFLEGGLTNYEIYNAYLNYYNSTVTQFKGEIPKKVVDFLRNNIQWVRSQSSASFYKTTDRTYDDEYWSQVYLVLRQFDGLVDGYNQYALPGANISFIDFLLYEYDAEISDIATAVNLSVISTNPKVNMYKSHCSSLVKMTPSGDLFSAHVTWTTFSNLLRVYKNYNLPFALNTTKSVVQTFSSIPGYLPSGDDWYVTDTGMTVAETTNMIFNETLYLYYVTETTVPYWIRCIVANRMADNGKEWSDVFAKYNSGTYNNQWIIVDYKLFTPGQPLQPNTLWIAEQVPGYVERADQTAVLQKNTYWASYNIPYYPFIYDISGYSFEEQNVGNQYSYTQCPRAQIFARDHHKVTDLESMKRIMRYNKWQTDPLSLGDSCNGISARCDLDPPDNLPWAFGAIDCKISSYDDIKIMKASAVAGPTWDSQPVFAWTDEWSNVPHYGEVEVYDFDWIDVYPGSPLFNNQKK